MNIPKFKLGDLVAHIASPNTVGVITQIENGVASILNIHAEAGTPSVATPATHPVEALTPVDLENHPVDLSDQHVDFIKAAQAAVVKIEDTIAQNSIPAVVKDSDPAPADPQPTKGKGKKSQPEVAA